MKLASKLVLPLILSSLLGLTACAQQVAPAPEDKSTTPAIKGEVAAAAISQSEKKATAKEAQETIILRFATHSSGPGTPVPDASVKWAKIVEERTNGRIKTQFFWGGSLATSREILEAIQSGSATAGEVTPSYSPKALSLFLGGELPTTVGEPAKLWQAYDTILERFPQFQAQAAKVNQVIVGWFPTSPYHILSRGEPVTSLADLKGKITGTGGAPMAKLMAAAGASVKDVPGSGMYEALQRGVIDLRPLSYESIQRFQLNEVIKSVTEINLRLANAVLLTVNKGIWDSLSSREQQIMIDAGKQVGREAALAQEGAGEEVKASLVKQGIKIVKFPDDEREALLNSPAVRELTVDYAQILKNMGLPSEEVLSIFEGKF